MTRASAPAFLAASAVSDRVSSVRSRRATRAPSVAKAIAVARPMPLAAPVMKATLPQKRWLSDMGETFRGLWGRLGRSGRCLRSGRLAGLAEHGESARLAIVDGV